VPGDPTSRVAGRVRGRLPLVYVAALGPDDWERLRDVRIRSILTEPALTWAWARESAFKEQHWRLRLSGARWWVAVDDGDVGLLSLIQEPGAPARERHLTALWVDPAARRRGAGSALVEAAVDDARAQDGVVALTVWAPTADDAVGRFLDAVGFTATGEAVAAPRAPGGEEERWSRLLLDD